MKLGDLGGWALGYHTHTVGLVGLGIACSGGHLLVLLHTLLAPRVRRGLIGSVRGPDTPVAGKALVVS